MLDIIYMKSISTHPLGNESCIFCPKSWSLILKNKDKAALCNAEYYYTMQTALWHQRHMPETLIPRSNKRAVWDYQAHVQPINQPTCDPFFKNCFCHRLTHRSLESAVVAPQSSLHRSTRWPIQVKNQCGFNPGHCDENPYLKGR